VPGCQWVSNMKAFSHHRILGSPTQTRWKTKHLLCCHAESGQWKTGVQVSSKYI